MNFEFQYLIFGFIFICVIPFIVFLNRSDIKKFRVVTSLTYLVLAIVYDIIASLIFTGNINYRMFTFISLCSIIPYALTFKTKKITSAIITYICFIFILTLSFYYLKL